MGWHTLTATSTAWAPAPVDTVTFSTLDAIRTAPVLNGTATIDHRISDITTFFTASYSGDRNFEATVSELLRVDAARATATVTLLDPGQFTHGRILTLVATVKLGDGSTPVGGVTFRNTSSGIYAENVPLVDGVARLLVCVGDASACPPDMPNLGPADQSLIVTYSATPTSLAGQSEPLAYTVTAATTTTTLEVNPTTVSPGGGMELVARVSNTSTPVLPDGNVAFFGRTPLTAGGSAEAFLGNASVVGGIARLDLGVGAGARDLRWPADAVVARYYGGADRFASSMDLVPVTINRIATSLGLFSREPVVFEGTRVQATVNQGPGVADDITGDVTFTSDTGQTCQASITPGSSLAECVLSWDTIGPHSFSASYNGDVIFAPAPSATRSVTVGQGTPTLGARVPYPVVAGASVDVTWQRPRGATGTVTVWGDGTQWCVTDVRDGVCTGTFTNASSRGGTVDVVVRYSGDDTWFGAQEELVTRVDGCVTLDVYSTDTKRGTVRVDTPSNCGTGGYTIGSDITVTATPIAPNEFVGWRKYDRTSPSLVDGSTKLSTTFTLTTDSWTWVHIAGFRTPCFPVGPDATGYGRFYSSPPSNCTLDDGEPGYLYGTTVRMTPIGVVNPEYDDRDIFYSFGRLPAGVTRDTDSFGRPRVTAVATSPVLIPVTFGPRCRVVTVELDPASPGDTSDVRTPDTCSSPTGDGFVPGTPVEVSAQSGDPDLALDSWAVNGVTAPALGRSATPTIGVEKVDLSVTARFVACYKVKVITDGAFVGRPIGEVEVDRAPNCPDGSKRYVAGTQLTFTPVLIHEDAAFRGWDLDQTMYRGGVTGSGPLPDEAKSVTVTENTRVTATFFLADACSRLTVRGDTGIVTLDENGCGPGFYDDQQKVFATRLGEPQRDLWMSRYRSRLGVTVNPDINLDVYARVRGDIRDCFGFLPTTGGPSTDLDWKTMKMPRSRGGHSDCAVGGDIAIQFEACQTLSPDITLAVVGDDTGTYRRRDLPGSMYIPGGSTGFASVSGFTWVEAVPMAEVGGEFVPDGQRPGPCADSGRAYQPGMTLMLWGASPTPGFEFTGWTSDAETDLLEDNPVLMDTDASRPVMPVSATYEVTCHRVTFGEGITIEGEAPRCPGTAEEDGMFIKGTGIKIRAVQHIGDRTFGAFTSGIIPSTVEVASYTEERTAFALVRGDMHVAAKYPTEGERWEAGWANAGKVMAGVAAAAVPLMLAVAFPVAAPFVFGAFAALGGAAALASLIPGGEDAAAFFDLVNPTKILDCATTWAFGASPVEPTSDASNLRATQKTVTKTLKRLKPPPTAAESAAKLTQTLAKSSEAGARSAVISMAKTDVLAIGGLAYGLYDAGLFDVDLDTFQTTDDLRDTATMTKCLDDAWRFADSNTSGG